MGVPIPPGVVFSYSSVVFPVNVRTKVTEEPVWSGDGRVIKYSKISIVTSGYITQDDADAMAGASPGEPLDALMLQIRRKLQVPGKNLIYQNRGFGQDLDINGNNQASIRDVAFGPKPGKLTWWSLGGAPDGCHGAGFEWEVSTSIAECENFEIKPRVFLEVSSSITYDLDEAGLLVRTTRGTAQIPMSLRADNTIERTIDQELLVILKPVPVGFLRRFSRTLSPDRATCTFNAVDTQKEVPPPDDVVQIDMKYKVRQEGVHLAVPNWRATISGTIRLSPTANKFLAWNRFMAIVAQRLAFIRQHPGANSHQEGGNLGPTAWKPKTLMVGSEFEEDLFSNTTQLTINFRILGAPFDTIAKLSGLWRPLLPAANPVMDGQWSADSWTRSLSNNAQWPTGVTGADFKPADDVILDVCSGPIIPTRPGPRTISSSKSKSDELLTQDQFNDNELEELDEGIKDGNIIPLAEQMYGPEETWVAWECTPERFTDHRQVRHKPLAGNVTTSRPPFDPFTDGPAKDTTDPVIGWAASVPDVIQQISAPSLTLRLRGFGVRLVYRVNPPRLISYGGRPAILQYERVSESVKGLTGDVKMYRTDWDLTYLIPSHTNKVPLLANPLIRTPGE